MYHNYTRDLLAIKQASDVAKYHSRFVDADVDITDDTSISPPAAPQGATWTGSGAILASISGPGATPANWANYSGSCEGIELHHAVKERRPRRIKLAQQEVQVRVVHGLV
jgi:hypothetical protein